MKSKPIGIVARQGHVRAATKALLAVILTLLALPCLLSAQTLQHRYSFVSDASDSVGGANGTVMDPQGGSSVTINNGLVLPGGGAQNYSGYVTLPGGILNTTTNVTVEFWAAEQATNGWAEVWSFNSGTPSYWAFISAGENDGSNVEQALRLNNAETDSQGGGWMPTTETHYTVTYNESTLADTIWQGQNQIATANVPTNSYTPGFQNFSTCFIGQDPWPDPQWQGTLYEFRIYNGVLSPYEITVDDVAGPTNLVTSYTPTAIAVLPNTNLVLTAAELPTVNATFTSSGTNVIANVTAYATNWVSSNPNVLAVETNGVIAAVGYGSATISATVSGVTGTSPTIFVTAPQTLLHRYSFVSDASDSVGGSAWNGTVVNPTGGSDATIANGLTLPGGGSGGYSGYVSFPSGILTNTTSLTVECWVTQNTANGWATIWDFANSGSENFEMCPFPQRGINNLDVAITPPAGEVDTVTGSTFPSGKEIYTAFTFNSSSLTGTIYTNGVLGGAQTVYPNANYIPSAMAAPSGTTDNWLGRDIYNDSQFQGTIYEFRIWNGAQPALYVAASSAAGPSVVVTNITLNALALNVASLSMVGSQNQQATLSGTFDQVSGVNVTANATNWVSSNPSVLTVSQSGLITGVSGGTATVSATVSGVTATSGTITVATTSPTISRYSSNVTAAVNDTVALSVSALGGGLNYQWSFDSTPITGATSSTLILTNVGYSSAGTYSVLVSNTAGSTNLSGSLTIVQAILRHRYSFVSDASDSVGGPAWTGTLAGPSGGTAATIADGLALHGGGGPGYSGYLTLPPGILTNTTSITIECWATQSAANTWAQIFNFGNGQSQNMGLIPLPGRDNGNLELGISPNNDELDTISSIHMPTGSEQAIAFTFNRGTYTSGIYDDGVPLGSLIFTNNPSTYIPGTLGGAGGTLNNVFGQDPYPDPQFQGTIYEFRIWDGAQTPLYLAVSAAAGPSTLVTNLTPSAVTITVTNYDVLQNVIQPATAIGNFSQVSGAVVTTAATNWISSNTGVLTVNSSGLVTAVGPGTATISATVAGVTGTSTTITVANVSPTFSGKPSNLLLAVNDTATFSAPATGGGLSYQWDFDGNPIQGATSSTLILTNLSLTNSGTYTVVVDNNVGTTNASATLAVEQAILRHRYSFVSDASDSVGGANGTIVPPGNASGQPATIDNGLSLPGNTHGGFNYSGYVLLPPGLLTNTTSLTIESWVTQNSANQWATVWDFANSGTVNFELCPAPNPGRNGGNMIAAFNPNNDESDLDTAVTFPSGSQEYVTLTVNAATLVANLYTNGIFCGTLTLPNSTYIPYGYGGSSGTVSNMLGNDIFGDDQFNGTLNEFRIWDGAITPLYLAVAEAAGASIAVTNLTPTAVTITVTNNTMIEGGSQPATATANFIQVSGVVVTGSVTNWTSSNTGVLTVNSNGIVTAVGTGNARISGSVGGTTGTSTTITVPNNPPIITQQPPASDQFLTGATLTASVGNIGTPPFVYRWFFNSGTTPISTSGSPTLTIPDVGSGNTGNYTVLVSNAYGSVLSSTMAVSVVTPTAYEQAVLQYGAIGYWPLQETSGTVAYDVIGGNNGTYESTSVAGSAVTPGESSGPSQSYFGNSSVAPLFQSAIVDIPEENLNITGPITIVAWVQVDSLGTSFYGMFAHGDQSWRLSCNASGQPGANDGAPPADATDPIAAPGINGDQNWHMVAYTYNGNTNQADNGSLYVDGTLVANNSVFVPPAGNNLDVWIGGSPDYGTQRVLPLASIAHAAVFTQVFTPAQVQGLYNGTFVVGPQTLHIAPSGSSVVLTWQTGTLLESTNVLGPWTTNSTATSPYTLPAADKEQFFRLLVNP